MNDHASYRSQMEKNSRSEEKKVFYCEVCEVPCASEFDLKKHFTEENHKKKEQDLMYGGFKVEELERIIKKVKCLKDYVEEPEREPLIGLECVVEFTYPGSAEPEYNCEMCGSKSKLVPMIVHLNGLKHRKAYISKYFPFVAKTRDPKEDIFQFLRRMALEIERYRGLKMFRVESTMEKEPADSLLHKDSDSLKRSRLESDCHSEDEPQKRKTGGFQGMLDSDSDSDSEDPIKKIEQANRAAEILSKVKPLNQAEAKSMQRTKDRAAALQSNVENRDVFVAGGQRKRDNEKSDHKNDLEGRDGKNMGLKYSTLWGEDEWKKFFRGRSSAEKAAWLETFHKNQPTCKISSDSGKLIQTPTQKRDHASGESREIKGHSAETERRDRHAGSERRDRRAGAERRERHAEAERRAETERRKRRAEAEKQVEAEKRTQAEDVAKAKSEPESITQGKTVAKAAPAQNQQCNIYVGSNCTIVKVDEEKLAQAKRVAERITKMMPNLPRPPVPSFIGKLRAFQNKPIGNVKRSDPSVRQAIAEKLAQTNRSQAGGENGKGDVEQVSCKPKLTEEAVVQLLENFLKESLSQDDAGSVSEDAVNWNQELSVQSQPPPFVTASGTSWNLGSAAEKQKNVHTLGTAYTIQNQPVQAAKKPLSYDTPTSSLDSSLQNPLSFQTMEEPSSIFESQTQSLPLRNSCVRENLTGTDDGFVSEYNGADKRSYSSIYGDGISSYGTDYQSSSLFGNVSGDSSNRTSDAASTDWCNLTLPRSPGNRLSSNYSSEQPNKLQGNADQDICSSLDRSYKDRFGEMAQARSSAQKSSSHHW